MKYRICPSGNGFLRVLCYCEETQFGHPTQVSTQAQLVATCDYLRVRLTRDLPPPDKILNIAQPRCLETSAGVPK